ncbi:MAG: PDC sensor domain-containing protein [Candidatus Thioglobus sp.]|nr:PDC sensor domain-containing protein [Candidatus Thioglobus sp.]
MQISALINKQKKNLSYELEGGFKQLAQQCAHIMDSVESLNGLDDLLHTYMKKCKYANLAYVLDRSGVQLSSNIDKTQILTDFQGQDLSARPFFNKVDIEHLFYLSDAYISGVTLKPCISAVHAICYDNVLIGMLVFDLELQKLPLLEQDIKGDDFRQIKGDPEIRSNLFNQTRVQSAMDQSIDTVHNIATELLCELGVFHIKLHYASSRATVWTYDDPYNYRLHVLDEIINPNICLLYPKKPYPSTAKVSHEQVKQILVHFHTMRFMDDNLYLKTASLNIMNGIVGLSFSCDGNHYLSVEEFLANFDKIYT